MPQDAQAKLARLEAIILEAMYFIILARVF